VASKREKLCIHLDDDFGGSPFEYSSPLGNLSDYRTLNSRYFPHPKKELLFEGRAAGIVGRAHWEERAEKH
jgi:hypothetical protein